MRNYFWFTFLFMGFLLSSKPISAAIYECINAGGNIEFRDMPCEQNVLGQRLVVDAHHKTEPKIVKIQEKETCKSKKRLASQEKRAERLKHRVEKEKIKIDKKQERQDLRCQKIEDKIALFESQLRAGCQFKRLEYLKNQLEHYCSMKQRYCGKQEL